MTQDVSDYFKLGIELGLTAIVLSALLSTYMLMQDLSFSISEQKATAASIREYREYVKYDDEIMYYYDVMNTVKEYWGSDVTVYIGTKDSAGNVYRVYYANGKGKNEGENWSDGSTWGKTSDKILTHLRTGYYKAKLVHGMNGNVVAIAFHSCDEDGGNTFDWAKSDYLSHLR